MNLHYNPRGCFRLLLRCQNWQTLARVLRTDNGDCLDFVVGVDNGLSDASAVDHAGNDLQVGNT